MIEDAVEGTPGTAFEDLVTVRRRMHASPDGSFGVALCLRDGDELVIVGPVAHLEERERAYVTGTWQEHASFGMQVRASAAEPLPPSEEDGLLAYLRRVRHIGDARARDLLRRHGTGVLEAIDADPRAALRAVGLRSRRAEEAVRSWNGLRATRELHLLLAPHGLAWLVGRIHKQLGAGALALVRERPYELTHLFGVGFATADRVARTLDTPVDPGSRARAGVLHVLGEAERDGSTCLPVPELAIRARELLGQAPDAALLQEMARDGDVALEAEGDTVWIARAETAALEAELAGRVWRLAEGTSSGRLKVPDTPPEDAAIEPAPEQWAAIRNAFSERLSLITGGPGTGKTSTIRLICAVAKAQKAEVVLVAPTGRAARRMEESTGLDASTVHSALGWVPGDGPALDEDTPLEGDLLVVDETSMANLDLLVTLLRAVGRRMHVVLVGDADQLAPVGAGKPFAELIDAEAAPVTRLAHIFRQAAGSMIVRGAHAVRQGLPPSFVAEAGLRRDLFLLERHDPAAALDEIVTLVAERLPRHYGIDAVADVQVFAPVYRGPLGIDALNLRLREALNPRGEPILGGRLRIGDKLMLSGRNLHDLGLMNGTVLRLVDHDAERERLVVEADGGTVILPEDEATKLQLAYACSVHKGQGIELPVAVLVAHPAAGAYFLRREMLYTAMTRARTATLVVGRSEVIARAAAAPDTARRHTRLAARLAPAT